MELLTAPSTKYTHTYKYTHEHGLVTAWLFSGYGLVTGWLLTGLIQPLLGQCLVGHGLVIAWLQPVHCLVTGWLLPIFILEF